MAVTETVRGLELLPLTLKKYLAGDKIVKKNYSSPWCQSVVRERKSRKAGRVAISSFFCAYFRDDRDTTAEATGGFGRSKLVID